MPTIINRNPKNLEVVSRFAVANKFGAKTAAILKQYASVTDGQKVSTKQIANEVGCNPCYVNQVVRQLKQIGAFKPAKRGEIVLDWKKLSSKKPVVQTGHRGACWDKPIVALAKPAPVTPVVTESVKTVKTGRMKGMTGCTPAPVLPKSAAPKEERLRAMIREEMVNAMNDFLKAALSFKSAFKPQ